MGSGILGLIGNYVNARHERQAEKDREALKRYYEAESAIRNPDIGKFMANAMEDAHVALADLVGDKEYKEHQPFVQRALEGLGNSVIGTMSGRMPMWGQRIPQIPTAVDPQTGQPINLGKGAPPGQAPPSQAGQVPPGLAPQGIPDEARTRLAGLLATLAGQAQQAQPPPGPLTGASTPASTLAPPTTEGGVTPATATGLIGDRGKGGFYTLPRDAKDPGRVEYLQHEGLFGKTPQEIQSIIDVYNHEVRAGRMTSQDAVAAIQKAIQANVDPTTRTAGEGTYTERWFQTPDTTDESGKKIPGKPKVLMESTRRPNELYDPDTGEYLTGKQVGERGYQRIRTPSAAQPKVMDADPNEQDVKDYIAENYPNFDLSKLPPGQGLQIRQDAQGHFTGEPHIKPLNPNQRESMRMADVKSFQAGVQKEDPPGSGKWRDLTSQEAEALGDAKYRQWRNASISRIVQGEDINAWKTGIAAEDAPLPSGYRVKPGYVDQLQPDQGAVAPVGAVGDAVTRMQGLPQQAPPSQTPNLAPGQLPSGAQPAAPGSPGAPPSAATPPQAPAIHAPTVQQPQVATPQAAQQAPGRGVGTDQEYIGNYLTWTKDKPLTSQAARGRAIMGQRIKQYYASQGQQLTDTQLAALQSSGENDWQAYLAAQAQNSQKQALVVPLVDTLDKFAKQWIAQARRLPDYGSKMSNSFHRDLISQFQNNPELASYKAQGLGLGATWTTVTSNAVNSNAQLESGNLKRTTDVLGHNATFDEAAAGVSRILLEGQTEKWRYQDAKYRIEQQKADSLFGKVADYGKTIGPAPAEPPNLPPPPDGYTKVYKQKGKPDQYIHYDALAGKYVPGMGRRKPFKLGRMAQ